MIRYIAFLRGINLGKRRIKMDRLSGLIKELGYENVATFIASGNVVFDTAGREGDIANEIEVHLRERLGYEVDTFVRSMSTLREIASRDVFSDAEGPGWRLYVTFLRDEPAESTAEALQGLETPDDCFEVHGREFYWLRNGRLSDSSISTTDFTRALGGASSTMRNMNTIARIIDKFGENADT